MTLKTIGRIPKTILIAVAVAFALPAMGQQPTPPAPPQMPTAQAAAPERARPRRPDLPASPRWADEATSAPARQGGGPPWMREWPGGSPPPALTLDRWEHADRQIAILRQMFEENDRIKSGLIDSLTAKKQGYEPGAMDANNLLKRQQIEDLLTQLHGLVSKDRRTAEEAAGIMMIAADTRDQWEGLLRKQLADSQSTTATVKVALPLPKERYEAWLTAAERLKANDKEGYFRLLLGNLLGPVAYQIPRPAMPPEEMSGGEGDTPPEAANAQEGGHGRQEQFGPGAANPHDRWIRRIERIQRRQADLADMVKRQQKEIERLRALLAEKAPDSLPPEGDPTPLDKIDPREPED